MLDVDVIPKILSTNLYSTWVLLLEFSLIFTIIVEVSIPSLGKIYLWLSLPSTTKPVCRYWPWKISIVPSDSPSVAVPVTVSGIENIYWDPDTSPLAITPGVNDIVSTVLARPLT